MKQFLGRTMRAIMAPFRKGLRLDEAFAGLVREMSQHADYARVRFDSIDGRLLELQRMIEDSRDAMLATSAQFGAEVARLEETQGALGHEIAHRLIHDSLNKGLAGVDQGVADLLNFSESHRGFRADAGLFFNPPIVVRYRPGDVEVAMVNERVVEVPFVLAAVASLEPGARILDVGADESTLSFSLASLGYQVTALDLNGYPLEHPNLTTLATPLEDFEPDQPFDAVICLSSIEHFGLGHYGPDSADLNADTRAIARLREIVRPGGLLILTTPYGRASISEFQRVYDEASLTNLLTPWANPDVRIVYRQGETTWVPVGLDGAPEGSEQVALVIATAGA